MRILHVNKFLHRRGGSEAYMLDLAELQRRAGHEVDFFSMQHPENDAAELDRYFPPYLELNPPPPTLPRRLKAAARMVWSLSAARGMEDAVRELRPDVAHLHLIHHQLSPSILRPLVDHGIPTVMTLHDFKLACPTYHFLDKGKLCEACLGGKFHHAALRKCKGGSLIESSLLAAELSIHTYLGAYAPVQVFICPSRFIAEKMGQARVFPDRLRVLPHFAVSAGVQTKRQPGGNLLYAGRLSSEKAVDVLIKAVGSMNPLPVLDVAGAGPEGERLESLAQAQAPGAVRFLGRLSRPELQGRLATAAALVIPSRFYENQPMIILEAFAAGIPVVGSDFGGIRELVEHGVDGLLVPPEQPDALADALRELLADPDRAFRMGQAGRAKVRDHFSVERHLRELEGLYAEASQRLRSLA